MERYLAIVEKALDQILSPPCADVRPLALHEAMRYAVGTGGKRLRPVICLAAAETAGGRAEDAVFPACAIELLHNYTLIHDDLPAMDNDVERRGQPTVWKKFGEATAILAGDALQALAYHVAAKAPRNVAEIVGVLGEMGVGVVRGQGEELEKSANGRMDELANEEIGEFIYRHKTADLFIAAAKMGALAVGADAAVVSALEDYALNLGLAFQYEDDLIDADGLYPPAEARRLAKEATAAAVAALGPLRGNASFLKSLAENLLERHQDNLV